MNSPKDALRTFFKKARAEYVKPMAPALLAKQFEAQVTLLLSQHMKDIPLQKCIGLYLPLETEADISSFLHLPVFQDCTFAFPIICTDGSMEFRTYVPNTTFKKSNFGFFFPKEGALVVPDIIFAPLLAFDKNGNRLGYGKGHFDVFVEKIRLSHHFIFYVGVAYPVQMYEEILPTHQGDKKLDAIILPDQCMFF